MKRAERQCLQCGRPLKGRIDKKFCDDTCRNAYNNNRNSRDAEIVRRVNNILSRNRRILASIIPPGQTHYRTTRQILLHQGFDFLLHTHRYTNRKGMEYIFCYEYGYLPLESGWLLIVRGRENLFAFPGTML